MVAFDRATYAGTIGPKAVVAAWAIAATVVLLTIGLADLLAGDSGRGDHVPTRTAETPARPTGASVPPRDRRAVRAWPASVSAASMRGVDI